MEIEHINEFENYIPQKTSLKWVDAEGYEHLLAFAYVVDAIYSEQFDQIVVLEKERICIFNPKGEFKFEIDVPLWRGHELRGINHTHLSSSGVSLLILPDDNNKNEWGDIYQYEVDLERREVTKKLGIYR